MPEDERNSSWEWLVKFTDAELPESSEDDEEDLGIINSAHDTITLHFDLGTPVNRYNNGELTLSGLALTVKTCLQFIQGSGAGELCTLFSDFFDTVGTGAGTTEEIEEFDFLLKELYDWADSPAIDSSGNFIPHTITCRVRAHAT